MSKGRYGGLRVSRRRAKKQAPTPWTWKDKLTVMGFLIGALALVMGLYVFISSQSYRQSIDRRVERWKSKYNLNQSQVRELTKIEAEFHAHDRPFSFRSHPSEEEKGEHRRELAKILGTKNPDQIRED